MATKKETAPKAAEVKAEVKPADVKKEAPKAAEVEVKSETKKAEPKKEAVKVEAKKETAKKPAAKKTAAKKTTAKKAAKVDNSETKIILECSAGNNDVNELVESVKADWASKGHRVSSIKSMEVYIQPENRVVYYVINGTEGQIGM